MPMRGEAREVKGADGAEEGEDALAAEGVELVACVMGAAPDADECEDAVAKYGAKLEASVVEEAGA